MISELMDFNISEKMTSYVCIKTVTQQPRPGMSNMRPFASTPAARTKDTVIWSFNGQKLQFL